MSQAIHGGTSGILADVDSSTKALNVLVKSGDIRVAATNGDGITLTDTGALRTSTGSLVFYDQVDGSSINTNLWSPVSDTMVADLASGFIRLNVTSPITTANKYSVLQSVKYIPMYSILELSVDINAMVNVQPQSNLTMELGLGVATTNATPTDGIFFRWNAQAQFQAVINNNGNETASAALSGTITDSLGGSVVMPPTSNAVHLFHFEIVEDAVEFFVDDVLVTTIQVPAGTSYPTNNGRQPLLARVYNGATPPSQAGGMSIASITVTQQDVAQNKLWADTLIALGRGAYQSPTLFTQTANHANSTNPVSATLSNTAAGYTTLGGRFQFAAVAGATTDFALFAYQVPVGYQFYITNLVISSINTGAAVAVSASILDWSLGVNSSAVSLATADGTNTWAPRRVPLGTQGFVTLAGIGQNANDIVRVFTPPLVVDSGRFLHVILQCPVGTATISQIIRGNVTINGYFE